MKSVERIKEKKKIEINTQVILASSSETRIRRLKSFFSNVEIVNHKINEDKEKKKNKNLNAKELARYLAQIKAESVNTKWKNDFIIGCDQTLECMKKIISKPMNLKEAKENLLFLSGKKHELHTCLYVLKNSKEYFVEQRTSYMMFKKITETQIEKYLRTNQKTAMSCVGSYKIEDNKKHNFLQIIKGEEEAIVGFPIKKFIQKLQREES